MTRYTLILFTIAVALTSSPISSVAEGPALSARFQLYSATVYSDADKQDVKHLFKIDTTTGKTWIFSTFPIKMSDNKEMVAISGWRLMEDDLMGTILKIQPPQK